MQELLDKINAEIRQLTRYQDVREVAAAYWFKPVKFDSSYWPTVQPIVFSDNVNEIYFDYHSWKFYAEVKNE